MKFKRQLIFALLTLVVFEPARAQEDAPPAIPAGRPDAAPAAESADAPVAPEPARPPESSRRSRRSSRSSHNDLVMIGAPVTVKEGESVRDVVAIGSNVRVDGTISGDLVTILGKVTLGPTARIERDVVVIGAVFDADPAAVIGRTPVVISPQALLTFTNMVPPMLGTAGREWIQTSLFRIRPLPLPHESIWAWLIAGLCFLLYAVIELLFPKTVRSTVTALEEKPGTAFMVGLLGGFLTLPLFLLLAVTVVGMVVVPFIALALFALILLGKTSVYHYAGLSMSKLTGLARFNNAFLALTVGAIAIFLLYCVPVLGAIVWLLASILGFGAALLVALGRNGPAPATATVAVPPALDPAGIETPPATLPRVGFWMRLLASFLDLLLVMIVVWLLSHNPKWFIPAWLAYHLAFWIWRGTTVGGVICALRIVRVDGRRMTPGVAIVRLLGSVFSLAVFGLGFFWAGWSSDRQSWHDLIAGTTIVRTPKQTPLI